MSDKVLIDRKKLEKIESENENLREAAVKLQNGLFLVVYKRAETRHHESIRIVGKEDVLFPIREVVSSEILESFEKRSDDMRKEHNDEIERLQGILSNRDDQIMSLQDELSKLKKPFWKIW